MKRLMIFLMVGSAFGVAGGAQAHCPAEAGTYYAVWGTFGEGADLVTVQATETLANEVCDDGESVQSATSGTLQIWVGEGDDPLLVCDRTDVDPSFDPFFFGVGIRTTTGEGESEARDGACGADVQWVVDPANPQPEDFTFFPAAASNGESGGHAGVLRPTPGHTRDFGIWWDGGEVAPNTDGNPGSFQTRAAYADYDE